MISSQLPSVLQQSNSNSLSMEQALKQVLLILEQCDCANIDEQTIINSIEDVEVMLRCIDRS